MNILIQDLSLKYGKKKIIESLNINIPGQSITSIVGPNGCGKSTLLKGIAKQIPIDSGRILIGDKNTSTLTTKQMSKLVGFLPQTPLAPDGIIVRSLVEYGRYPHQGIFRNWTERDEQIVSDSLSATGVLEYADCKLDQLSGGQRQRSWIAMVVAQQTPIFLLDEPTSMLDIGHQIEVVKMIKSLSKLGHTIVIVLHDLILASRISNFVIAMKDGNILAKGKPSEVVGKKLLKDLYNVDSHILSHPNDGSQVVIADY